MSMAPDVRKAGILLDLELAFVEMNPNIFSREYLEVLKSENDGIEREVLPQMERL